VPKDEQEEVALDEREDGFRPRKTRPKGWQKQAIKDGVIPDPDAPLDALMASHDATVIDVPVGRLELKG
jgi:hypothetical protein